jgi:hypothetical protein
MSNFKSIDFTKRYKNALLKNFKLSYVKINKLLAKSYSYKKKKKKKKHKLIYLDKRLLKDLFISKFRCVKKRYKGKLFKFTEKYKKKFIIKHTSFFFRLYVIYFF